MIDRTIARGLASALCVLSIAAVSPAARAQSTPIAGSYPLTGAPLLSPGRALVLITAPDSSVIEYEAEMADLPGYPGSQLMQVTPFGPSVALNIAPPPISSYLLGYPDFGVIVAQSWDPTWFMLSGEYAGYQFDLMPQPELTSPKVDTGIDPAPQDPPGPQVKAWVIQTGIAQHGIFIATQGTDVTYTQFGTLTITWKGKKADGSDASGGCGGMTSGSTANGGHDTAIDGSKVYVDSDTTVNGGSYPHQGAGHVGRFNGQDCQVLQDVPNLRDPAGVEAKIEGANPGVDVKEITATWRFTTYVIVHTQNGPKVVKRIRWTHTETIDLELVGGGDDPANGDFGGPAPLDPNSQSNGFSTNGQPQIDDVNKMDPQHEQALNEFNATPAVFNGTTPVGGY